MRANITKNRLVLLGLVVIGCALVLLIVPQFILRLPKWVYLYRELPLVEAEVRKMPGVSIQQVVDLGPYDEVNVYVWLQIEGKGRLVLGEPTRDSFTGGGYIYIREIKDCATLLSSPPNPPWRFNTVKEVIEKYDEIYAKLQDEKLCQ